MCQGQYTQVTGPSWWERFGHGRVEPLLSILFPLHDEQNMFPKFHVYPEHQTVALFGM